MLRNGGSSRAATQLRLLVIASAVGLGLLAGCEQLNQFIPNNSSSGGSDVTPAAGPTEKVSDAAEDAALASNPSYTLYSFDEAGAGIVPAGFKALSTGAPGAWSVVQDSSAISGEFVVEQSDATEGARYTALLLENTPQYSKLDVRTRVKISGTGANQTAGVMVHSRGTAGDGYAVLLNSTDRTITVERVVGGTGLALKGKGTLSAITAISTPGVTPDKWHSIRVSVDSSDKEKVEIEVYVNGRKVFEGRDNVHLGVGSAGLITKGDTVARFDNFTTNERRAVEAPKAPTVVATPAPVAPGKKPPKIDRCKFRTEYTFDDQTVGQPPKEMESIIAGDTHVPGTWTVVGNDADNPNMLLQSSDVADGGRFSALVQTPWIYTDFESEVELRTKSGEKEYREAGIVFRFQDRKNYYFASVNTSTDKVSLVRVANGERQNMGTKTLNLMNDKWYELRVTAKGMEIDVELNGDSVLSATDNTFMAGRVGVFTRSNTVTNFDGFKVCAFVPPTQ